MPMNPQVLKVTHVCGRAHCQSF